MRGRRFEWLRNEHRRLSGVDLADDVSLSACPLPS